MLWVWRQGYQEVRKEEKDRKMYRDRLQYIEKITGSLAFFSHYWFNM